MKTIDLFERYDLLPENIQAILMEYSDMDNDCASCEKLLDEMMANGYTFDYELDGVPFGLREIDTLRYFVYKLSHDNGQICQKTAAHSITRAIEQIMIFESCPRIAIEIKEVPKSLWRMSAKTLWNKKI